MSARSLDGEEENCLGLLGAERSWLLELPPINTSESVLRDAPVPSARLLGSLLSLGKKVSDISLSLSHVESLLWGWIWGQPEQRTLCFHSSALGRAQQVYIFTPRFLSPVLALPLTCLVSSWQASFPCSASVSSQECSGPSLSLFQKGSGI